MGFQIPDNFKCFLGIGDIFSFFPPGGEWGGGPGCLLPNFYYLPPGQWRGHSYRGNRGFIFPVAKLLSSITRSVSGPQLLRQQEIRVSCFQKSIIYSTALREVATDSSKKSIRLFPFPTYLLLERRKSGNGNPIKKMYFTHGHIPA